MWQTKFHSFHNGQLLTLIIMERPLACLIAPSRMTRSPAITWFFVWRLTAPLAVLAVSWASSSSESVSMKGSSPAIPHQVSSSSRRFV